MSNNSVFQSEKLSEQLQAMATVVYNAAQLCQEDPLALLALLRQLEQLHRDIRDGVFQESLPVNRRQLYSLLKDIESEGGWPYIERMRLQDFLVNLLQEDTEEDSPEENSGDGLIGDRSLS